MAYISNSSALDYHCRLGHLSLPTLKCFVPTLGQVSSLECESCQLRKHHCVSYPNLVNKRADKPVDLVHSDIKGLCQLPSKLRFRYFVSFVDISAKISFLGIYHI